MPKNNNLLIFVNQILNKMSIYEEDTSYNSNEQEYTKYQTLIDTKDILESTLKNSDLKDLFKDCDLSIEERKEKESNFIKIVSEKVDKMTDEQIDMFMEWFNELN